MLMRGGGRISLRGCMGVWVHVRVRVWHARANWQVRVVAAVKFAFVPRFMSVRGSTRSGAYTITACIVTACIVVAYTVMADILMGDLGGVPLHTSSEGCPSAHHTYIVMTFIVYGLYSLWPI